MHFVMDNQNTERKLHIIVGSFRISILNAKTPQKRAFWNRVHGYKNCLQLYVVNVFEFYVDKRKRTCVLQRIHDYGYCRQL